MQIDQTLLEHKITLLRSYFVQRPSAALGFSGGVDSSFLLSFAVECGADIRAYYLSTPFQPAFERKDAEKLAAQIGAKLTVIPLSLCTQNPQDKIILENPANRCYYCKKTLFGVLKEAALQDGYSRLLEGTNASDEVQDRPGYRALGELCVESPLRLCGLTKAEIRAASKARGLFTWNKPSYACLATRIETGTFITPEALARVEASEALLHQRGYTDFRVRERHTANGSRYALVQVTSAQHSQAQAEQPALQALLSGLYETVVIDKEVRPQSVDKG